MHKGFGALQTPPLLISAPTGPICPLNQHYELCGPACPATCRGQAEAEQCEGPMPCTEGCFCNDGFLLSGDRCVPLAQCGCLHEGRYYRLGEKFFTCPHCSERCTCKAAGVVECQPEGCTADEVCTVQDGVRGCYPHECGRCEVLGAVSYSTFDGHPLRFAGTCTYTLAAAEAAGPKDPLVPFTVEVVKGSGKEGPFIRQLLVTVHGVTVGMAKGIRWEVTVSGAAFGCNNHFGVQSLACKLLFSLQMPFWGPQQDVQTLPWGTQPDVQTRLWGANPALACKAGSAGPTLGCKPDVGVHSKMCKPHFGVQTPLRGAQQDMQTLLQGAKPSRKTPF